MGLENFMYANCQSCLKDGVVETFRDFLLGCPAFAWMRLKLLECHLGQLDEINIRRLSILDLSLFLRF